VSENLLSGERVKMIIVRKIRNNLGSFKELELFIRIFLLVTILPLLLKFLQISRLMKMLTPTDLKAQKNLSLAEYRDKVVKYTDYILGLNFWIYKTTCLKRSLVLYHFLRKSGINVHVCFGVRYKEGLLLGEGKKELEGHAWLLYNGNIFLEKDILMPQSFKAVYCFPERRQAA
jgi:hypothetical protein